LVCPTIPHAYAFARFLRLEVVPHAYGIPGFALKITATIYLPLNPHLAPR
jgi:hypothetical protein